MKIKEGMYVKTKHGIRKIIKIDEDNNYYIDKTYVNDFRQEINCISDSCIIGEPSFNIIDLIEEGDILLLFDKEYEKKYKAEVVVDGENFKSVINYEQDTLLNLEYELITNEHIELSEILTKEQFEQMSYKVGE